MPGTIDVIIVTYNSAATVTTALDFVLSSPRVHGTVVIDNASGDSSAEVASSAGAQTVLRNPANAGFAAAVNAGFAHCSGDYVLLLNPDAAIEPRSLELLAVALDETPAAVMAGPVLVADDGRLDLGARHFSTAAGRLLWHLPLPRRPPWATPEYAGSSAIMASPSSLPVDYLWGAALLVRRRFLDDIGGLDERFFLYSEDEDLGREARARGYVSLLVPSARARHQGGASTPDAALALARVIAANALLLEKWEGRRVARLYRRGIGPILGMRAVVLSAAGRRAEADLAERTRKVLRTPHALGTPHSLQQAGSPACAPRVATPGTQGAAGQALGYAAGTCRLAARVVAKAVCSLLDRASSTDSDALEELEGRVLSSLEPTGAASVRNAETIAVAGEPLVSVILPVYNAASINPAYLWAALESVAAQGGVPLELIVVNDGSTDETSELVAAFFHTHPRLSGRLLDKPNGGQSSARNYGAATSRGAWLGFLDQDDLWTSGHMRAVLPHLTAEVDVAYTDADTIDEGGRVKDVGIHRNLGLGGGHPKTCLEDAMFQDVFVMPGVTTIRREFFQTIGGFDERLSGYEDDDLFLRCLETGRLRYVPVSTLLWRIHTGSASNSDRMIVSGLRYCRKLMDRYAVGGQLSPTDRLLALRFLRVFLSHASLQLLSDNPLFERNLAAAEWLLPHVGAVDRAAFATTRWAWRRKSFAARCARSWFLNGLQSAAN